MNSWMESQLPEGVRHRLLLLRHGEPVAAAEGRCYGSLDVALSSAGRERVKRVARHLARVPVAVIYSSPLARATESAAILAHQMEVPVIIDPRLSEMYFGALEGMRYEDLERELPELFATWMRSPTTVRFPRGESYATLQRRVCASLDEIRRQNPAKIVTVVAHGGVIRAALARDLGLDAEAIFRLDQSYGALTCVDYYDRIAVIRTLNWLPP